MLRKASTGNQFITVGNLPADTTSFVDKGVLPGTNYDYHIQCYNVAGYSDFAGINLTTPLAAPAVTAAASDKVVALSWAAVPGAATYNVYRSLTPGGEGTTPYAAGDANTTFTDTGLTDGTTYYYQVTAADPLIEGSGSAETPATPAATVVTPPTYPTAPPPTPTGLTATWSGKAVVLTWNPSPGATAYNIYRGTTHAGESLTPYAYSVAGTSFTDTNVTANTAYYYYITAINTRYQSHRGDEAAALVV